MESAEEPLGSGGIVCFALSLILKPQIGVFVLIYFLLANRTYRRRALAVAALAALFCLPGLVLAAAHPQAAHWFRDLSLNLRGISMHGNLSDPGPANLDSYMIVNLQTVIGVFRDNASFENHLVWLICGAFFALWIYITVRAKSSEAKDLLGIASIAAMTLLPIYHRHYDVRLLVLAFPAMALFATRGDRPSDSRPRPTGGPQQTHQQSKGKSHEMAALRAGGPSGRTPRSRRLLGPHL